MVDTPAVSGVAGRSARALFELALAANRSMHDARAEADTLIEKALTRQPMTLMATGLAFPTAYHAPFRQTQG